jgi:hypothetical protein
MVWYAPSTWLDETAAVVREFKRNGYIVEHSRKTSSYRDSYKVRGSSCKVGSRYPIQGMLYRTQDGTPEFSYERTPEEKVMEILEEMKVEDKTELYSFN